jgi:hypothetical protein
LTDDQTILDIKQIIETLLNQQKERLAEETKSHDATNKIFTKHGKLSKTKKKKTNRYNRK